MLVEVKIVEVVTEDGRLLRKDPEPGLKRRQRASLRGMRRRHVHPVQTGHGGLDAWDRSGQRLRAAVLDVIEVEDRDLEHLIQGNGHEVVNDLQSRVVKPGLSQEGGIGSLDVGAAFARHHSPDVVAGTRQLPSCGNGGTGLLCADGVRVDLLIPVDGEGPAFRDER